MSDKPRNTTNRRTFTNSTYTSYDNQLSAMSMTLMGSASMITIAPIMSDRIGKAPERGEQMYDYDSSLNFFMTAEMAENLRTALTRLKEMTEEELEKVKTVVINGTGGKHRSITIYAPGNLKLKIKGKSVTFSDNFALKFEQEDNDSGDIEKAFHLINVSAIDFNTVDGDDQIVYDAGLEMLTAMCDTIIENALGLPMHIARIAASMVGNTGGKQAKRGKRGSAFSEDGDDDDDNTDSDDDGEEETTSSRRSSRRNAGGSSRSSRSGGSKSTRRNKSLDEKFDDDDGDEETDDGENTSTRRRPRNSGKSLADEFSDDDDNSEEQTDLEV